MPHDDLGMAERMETLPSDQVRDERTASKVPPHNCVPTWIDRLLDAVRELNPSQITREFVSANVIGSKNEGKVLIAARFLGLIDENRNVTPRLRALRVVGPEFTPNLAIVVQQAYSDLLNTVSIKSATYDRLTNFLMQKYSMGQSQASAAVRFFVHMASRAGMDLSDELSKPSGTTHTQSPRTDHTPKISASKKQPSLLQGQEVEVEAVATIEGSFGRIRIVDQSTLELARRSLDIIEQKLKQKGQNE